MESESDYSVGEAPTSAGVSWRQLGMGQSATTTPTDLDFRLVASRWVT